MARLRRKSVSKSMVSANTTGNVRRLVSQRRGKLMMVESSIKKGMMMLRRARAT